MTDNEKCSDCGGLLGTGEEPGRPCFACQRLARVRMRSERYVPKERYEALAAELAQTQKQIVDLLSICQEFTSLLGLTTYGARHGDVMRDLRAVFATFREATP